MGVAMNIKIPDWLTIICAIVLPFFLIIGFVHDDIKDEKTKHELNYHINQILSLYDSEEFGNVINSSNEVLNNTSPKEYPKEYAKLKEIVGQSYYALSKINDSEISETNLEKSIKAYGETLEIYNIDTYPIEYAFTKVHIGDSYRDLAKLQETNMKKSDYNFKSYTAYGDSLKIITAENYPEMYSYVIENKKNVLQVQYTVTSADPMNFGGFGIVVG